MSPARPSILPRRVTEPAQTATLASTARDQTLRTLEMLGAMGYREVWCRGEDADATTIALAAQEGWFIGARHDGRIKFCRAAPTPVQAPPPDSYVSPSRTQSPTRLPPEPGPSPYARLRALSPDALPPRASSAQERRDSVTWTRSARAESADAVLACPDIYGRPNRGPQRTASHTPSVLVSPPPEEGMADDYFAYIPPDIMSLVAAQSPRLPDVPESPENSLGSDEVVFAGARSEGSVYSRDSRDSFKDLLFEFDVVDPFAPQDASSSSGRTRSPSPPPLRPLVPFRPPTPELVVRAPRGEASQVDARSHLRPTFQLSRLASDPGPATHAGPSFSLNPVAAPTLRRAPAVRRISREPLTLKDLKRGSL